MKINGKRYSSIWIMPLMLILGVFGFGLYCISGLPKPWSKATPKAYESVNYQHLLSLSKLVCGAERNNVWSWDTIEQMALKDGVPLTEHGKIEVPTGRYFTVYNHPQGTLSIVISGNVRDDYGMVWAITKDGKIVKYISE